MMRRFVASVLALGIVGIGTPAGAMSMTVVGDQMLLAGRVIAGDAERFASNLAAHPEIATIVFGDSPGGLAGANDQITALIEEHRLDTVVAGSCVSACAMMFLAGTNRTFGDALPLARESLGFHSSYRQGGGLAPAGRLAALKARVLERTGGKIHPELVDSWLHFVNPANMVRFRPPDSKHDSVYYCALQRGPNAGDFGQCHALTGVDALTEGVITAAQITHVNR